MTTTDFPAARKRFIFTKRCVVVVSLALVAAACGSSSPVAEDELTTTTSVLDTTTTLAPVSTTTVEDGIPGSFSEVQPAVVQIVSQGTFRDPEIGVTNGSGAGSGFLISSDGLAVTNNHVVAGAATLEVFVGGDTSQGYNATIVGVSECNDLALIDISESEPLPYLEWFDGDITAGLDVYAAGYPLGDPEFTLTRGIVSKAKAGGDLTGTSSIDHTIEHDANIQPGNSGGPLISEDGRIVGVNYAGGAAATTTAQFFAIASDLAVPVIDTLAQGDFESIGINGWAVVDDSTDVAGIWVAGVTAGSPASATGVLPGDILTKMNGLPVGADGTFKDYCDVLRTAGDNPIALEVLRFDTSEVLRGELNGNRPLELAFTFGGAVEAETEVGQGGQAYTSYQTIVDDLGRIEVEVPSEWSDINTAPFEGDSGVTTPQIVASTDLVRYNETFNVPGMSLMRWEGITIDQALEIYLGAFGDNCTALPPEPFTNADFSGEYQIYSDCGGTETAFLVLAVNPAGSANTTVLMAVQIVTEADLAALDRMFSTFRMLN